MEDDDSHALAVLLRVSFAHRVLQDVMPGKKREVGGEGWWESNGSGSPSVKQLLLICAQVEGEGSRPARRSYLQ